MFTVCETPAFTRNYLKYWSEDEYEEFKTFIASNPDCGVVEPDVGGLRTVRWAGKGKGKKGGVRVIYLNRLDNGQIWLLTLYSKDSVNQIDKKTLRLFAEKMNEHFNR